MSQVEKIKHECPKCHKKGDFDDWVSLNVDLNPEQKERLFNNEIFTYHCPYCGEESPVLGSMLYHDMKHKFMLIFNWIKFHEYENDDFERPDSYGTQEGYTYRCVYGLNSFKEKILILEQGLNDVAVEHMKYMISHVIVPEIGEKGYELLFDHVGDESEEYPYGKIYFQFKDDHDEVYRTGFAMDNYYEHCLACRLDPRMQVQGCPCIDEEWMSQQMKKEE